MSFEKIFIEKDELYDWVPSTDRQCADAQVPIEYVEKLQEAITVYKNACAIINIYLDSHPEDIF